MAPSIEQIEVQIGRHLKRGDVLVSRSVVDPHQKSLNEIVNTQVSINLFLPGYISAPGVEHRLLTPVGPVSCGDRGYNLIDDGCWEGIIKLEDRTDISALKKLRLEIKNLIKK